MEIPVNQDLIIDKPQADTLFLGVGDSYSYYIASKHQFQIKMYKNMKVFGHAEKCMECRELESGFLVKAYWGEFEALKTEYQVVQSGASLIKNPQL